jgi:hypothetical protein
MNKSIDDEIEEGHHSQDDLTTDDNIPTESKPKTSTSLHKGSDLVLSWK